MAGKFTLDLSRIISKAQGETELIVKKVMLEAFSSVINMTPVDTGRARGNWVVSQGSYSTGYNTDSFDKSGSQALAKAATGVTAAKIGDSSIYLTNSLPYIQKLEYGYSKQAAEGMVRVTLSRIAARYGA